MLLHALYDRSTGAVRPSYVENITRAARWANLALRQDKTFFGSPRTAGSLQIHPNESAFLLAADRNARAVSIHNVGDHRRLSLGGDPVGEPVAAFSTRPVASAHWYPQDPGLFAILEQGGSVSIWDTERGISQQSLQNSRMAARDVDFSPHKDLLVLAGASFNGDVHGGVEIYDLLCGATSLYLPSSTTNSVSSSPRQPYLIVTAGKGLALWDIRRSGKTALVHSFEQKKVAIPMADHVGEPGTFLDIGYVWEHSTETSDVEARATKRRKKSNSGARTNDRTPRYQAARFTEDGRHILSTDGSTGTVRLWDAMTGHCIIPRYGVTVADGSLGKYGFCDSNDSSTVFVSGSDGVGAFDIISGYQFQLHRGHFAGGVMCVNSKREEMYVCKSEIVAFGPACEDQVRSGSESGPDPSTRPDAAAVDDDWT